MRYMEKYSLDKDYLTVRAVLLQRRARPTDPMVPFHRVIRWDEESIGRRFDSLSLCHPLGTHL